VAGEVNLKVPKLRRQTFETAIIERYRRRESSVEEALIEMYLAGISVRRVEDITEALCHEAQLGRRGPQRFAAGGLGRRRLPRDPGDLRGRQGGQIRLVCVSAPSGRPRPEWRAAGHFRRLGGLLESIADFLPEARYQRCMVHFYRNVFSHVPSTRVREVSHMLKATHAQESREAADNKAKAIVYDLRASKIGKAADLVEQAVHETLTYCRRTRVVGAFPDGQSCLNLAATRLRTSPERRGPPNAT